MSEALVFRRHGLETDVEAAFDLVQRGTGDLVTPPAM